MALVVEPLRPPKASGRALEGRFFHGFVAPSPRPQHEGYASGNDRTRSRPQDQRLIPTLTRSRRLGARIVEAKSPQEIAKERRR